MKVLVVGAGTMGSLITLSLAEAKHSVLLYDISETALQKGFATIDKTLEKMVQKSKITSVQKLETMNHIYLTLSLEEAKHVDFVIEAASEKCEIKQAIFKELDQTIQPNAILSTNTSSLSIADIAKDVKRIDKVCGVHFFNPANIMKLVELIAPITTSVETITITKELISSLGKTAVVVKESPGFVVNRILIPMINEAIGLASEQVASVSDIDQAMMLGANHPIGPLALADLIGNDIVLAIMTSLHQELKHDKYAPHPYLIEMVEQNKLGRKTKQGFYTYE